MSASSIFVSLFESAPRIIHMTLDLSWMYLTLDWQVRKARKAFEKQLVLQGMSKTDARRLSACYEELKNNILGMMKQGMRLEPWQRRRRT